MISGFAGRVGLICVVVTAMATGLFTLLVSWQIEIEARRAIDRELVAVVGGLAAAVDGCWDDHTALQDLVKRSSGVTGHRLTIIALDGRVLADSHRDPLTMDNHGDRPEIRSAVLRGRGEASRLSASTGRATRYIAHRHANHRGVVRSALPLRQVDEQVATGRAVLLFPSILAMIVALLLGAWSTRLIDRPLRVLTGAVRTLASGERPSRLAMATRRDEIGVLARAFNDLNEQLCQRLADLHGQRTTLEAILSGMTEGVIAVDCQERILHLNSTAAALLGREGANQGRPIWEVCRFTAIAQVLGSALHQGASQNEEMELDLGGRSRHLHLVAAPVQGVEGDVIGAVAVLHDITEIRRSEALRRDFVANLSHELKTPLTALLGNIETILDDSADMPSAMRDNFLRSCLRQIERLELLSRDLLTLARLEDEDATCQREDCRLDKLISDIGAHWQTAAVRQGLTLTVRIDGPCTVAVDAEGLRQAIDNLLDNAFHYTPSGGTVTLGLSHHADRVEISVRDSGVGIDPRHHRQVFHRFYRVDKARSREYGGTGLGLAIVKHVALSHGAAVGLDSAPGRGSTFTISLPV